MKLPLCTVAALTPKGEHGFQKISKLSSSVFLFPLWVMECEDFRSDIKLRSGEVHKISSPIIQGYFEAHVLKLMTFARSQDSTSIAKGKTFPTLKVLLDQQYVI